jgi:hypothetical protein
MESADHGKQALNRDAAHRRELAGAGHHHPQRIAAFNAKLPGQLLTDNDVVLARLQQLLLDVDQERRQRIGFSGLTPNITPTATLRALCSTTSPVVSGATRLTPCRFVL